MVVPIGNGFLVADCDPVMGHLKHRKGHSMILFGTFSIVIIIIGQVYRRMCTTSHTYSYKYKVQNTLIMGGGVKQFEKNNN